MSPESLVGLPFLLIPGKPPDHQVLGTDEYGNKLRVADVQQVFNDALLIDAIRGNGSYAAAAGPLESQCLKLAETAYGRTLSATIEIWKTLRKSTGPMELCQ